MKKQFYSSTTLLLIAGLFFVFVGVTGAIFQNIRLDLTENKLFTLSEGSKNIIKNLENPVTLQFFFSKKMVDNDAGMASLSDYAKRVEAFISEYHLLNTSQLSLSIIDPEPFSEEEELAADLGVQGVPMNNGDSLYFGLVGTNAEGHREVIPFFQSEKEQFLEYDISKLIYSLSHPEKIKVGIISNIEINGGYNYQTGQQKPAWAIIGQLTQLFDVKMLEPAIDIIPGDVDLLIAIQPETLTTPTQYAIDQFVMAGGKTMVLVDPVAELAQASGAAASTVEQQTAFAGIMKAWGIGVELNGIVGDSQNAMLVNMGQEFGSVRMMSLLNLKADAINQDDIITNGLENVNIASAGVLSLIEGAPAKVTALMTTSNSTMLYDPEIFRTATDPREITRLFSSSDETYMLAARVEGAASSGFESAPDKPEQTKTDVSTDDKIDETKKEENLTAPTHLSRSEQINVVVIADTDILTDRLWVRVQNFFGQQVATAWADNASLLINSIENLSGSSDLISIRSRGKFYRGFDVVDQLRRNTEEKFRDKEVELNEKLKAAEEKLAELQSARTDDKTNVTPEQQAALVEFQKEKISIRKDLREVRHALDKDIESLGTWVKVINILLMPCLIVICVWAWFVYRKKQVQRKAKRFS